MSLKNILLSVAYVLVVLLKKGIFSVRISYILTRVHFIETLIHYNI